MAEEKAIANSSLDVRLLINKKNRRVLYAEAGKYFVDFVLGFLLLPTGVVMRLMPKHGKTPSRQWKHSNLYKSVEKLNATYMTSDKTLLRKPH